MTRRDIIRAFALLILTAAATVEAAQITLRSVSQSHSPPRFIESSQGGTKVISGLCIDIMRAVEKLDPEIRFTGDQDAMPLLRMFAMLQAGEIDVAFCLTKDAKREQHFRFIDPPLYQINYKMAVRADDPIEVHSFDDIRKLGDDGVILVNFGTYSAQFLEGVGGLKIDATGRTQKDNIRKLIAGDGRFYYRHDLGLEAELKSSGLAKDIRILPTVFDKQAQYVMFSASTDPVAVERVRKALEQLKASGELAKLYAKHHGTP